MFMLLVQTCVCCSVQQPCRSDGTHLRIVILITFFIQRSYLISLYPKILQKEKIKCLLNNTANIHLNRKTLVILMVKNSFTFNSINFIKTTFKVLSKNDKLVYCLWVHLKHCRMKRRQNRLYDNLINFKKP